MASVLPARPWRRSLSTWCNWNNKTNIHLLNHSNKTARVNMSTVIHIQHDASITTVKAKPTGRHIYSADYRAYSNSNTNFTALYNVNCHSFTSVLLVSSKQPFFPANLSYVCQVLLFALIKDESRACVSAGIHVISQRTVSLAGKYVTHHTSPGIEPITAV